MKHTLKITLFLLAIFFFSQVIGLGIVNQNIDHKKLAETGNLTFKDTAFERPTDYGNWEWLYIFGAVIVGTILVLLIIKFNKPILWKIWFLLAVVICLTSAFYAFVPSANTAIKFAVSLILSIVLGLWKTFKPNLYIHNFTELFVYGGLAALFVPVINIFSVLMLLVLISAYDMYAVWKSKHMVSMAKFQSNTNIFAGLLIPYSKESVKNAFSSSSKSAKNVKGKSKKIEIRNAVLGGGDIGFPLIFSGVVMKNLMLVDSVAMGFMKTLIISVCVTLALGILLFKAKQDKFYPAMPFLTAGCLVGYGIIWLIGMV